ncbi:MAG: hypothetical protein FWC33_02895 [Candidatus Bathyarchaeota archaeon]|nr:hypothetical protein [Candidatus Termiticorpusculum sp.]
MKNIKTFPVFLLLAILVGSFVTLPTTCAASANEERALTFVSNVLPFDTNKYSATLTNVIEKPATGPNDYNQEKFRCTLKADNSTIDIDVTFNNNILSRCQLLTSSTGPVFQETSNENLIDTAKNFIEKYQAFTKENLSDMLNALSKVDSTKNVTATSGNIKMQISNYKLGIRDVTVFRWAVAINGVEYSYIELEYRDGVFKSFNDNRRIVKIGNTDVNISQEQSVELALQYIETYSYKAIAGTRDDPYYVDVTDFNVAMERISCKLIPYPDESSAFGPCWSVELPIVGDYGSIWALSVFVHAGSGEILQCRPLGTGTTGLHPLDEQNSNMWFIGVAVVAVVAVAVTALLVTKRGVKRR